MNRLGWLGIYLGVSLLVAWSIAAEPERDVPWKAQAEIARRGPLAERVTGLQIGIDPVTAISAAMQPPADDSHKWLFTLVTMKNCQWCEKLRADFDNDTKLKAWVDTKDYTKSWAHYQIVQIEDKSQEWRWKDFKPTQFPALIVQPPVNGSWGDPHTIVYLRQGYLPPADLDAAIRKSIQLYASKIFPRHLTWQAKQSPAAVEITDAGFQQGGAEQSGGGWTPPVTPPSPLPQLPNLPMTPQSYPPTTDPSTPGGLTIPLSLPSLSTIFLLLTAVSNMWMLYREIAQKVGVKLLLTDEQAQRLTDLLPKLNSGASPPASGS